MGREAGVKRLTARERMALQSVGIVLNNYSAEELRALEGDNRAAVMRMTASALEQITASGASTSLAAIISEIRPASSVVALLAFLTTPQPDLADDWDEPTSPIRWLTSGRPTEAVARLAAFL